MLSPADLADRLSAALGVLDHGPQDAPPRQRTLRATLDWSYDLLDDDERHAFVALGAFAGGCELDAAEAVTGAGLDVLEGLVAKSLVTVREARLGMLEPVRQYAAERLAGSADLETIHARHFGDYLALARSVEPDLFVRGRSSPLLPVLRRERDNLDVAFERAIAARPIDALALAGELSTYGWHANAAEQVGRWCERALSAAGEDAPAELRARALLAAGSNNAEYMTDPERVSAALALFRQLGDERWIVRSLLALSNARSIRGDYEQARRAADEALALARRLGDPG